MSQQLLNPGSYTIDFGVYKGLVIDDIPMVYLKEHYEFLHELDEPSDQIKNFLKQCELYFDDAGYSHLYKN